MATEQLPASTYAIAGQSAVTGYEVISQTFGFEEDGEDKKDGTGQHKARINYSRRRTCQLVLEALTTATAGAYVVGGGLDASYVPGGVVWKIRSVTEGKTRSVPTINLDLIALTDELA
jgi:hypothetical protein